jgi:DNA-binding protein HU-beta
MTKAEIVSNISNDLGIEKSDVLAILESFMSEVKGSLESGNNVYLRGFGSFVIKTRAKKDWKKYIEKYFNQYTGSQQTCI